MRVLVVGRNAEVLARVAGTFANNLQISIAATKADCLGLLANSCFDLIIACETLPDGSGLEVLNHVVVNSPNTLRIFAARPATLDLLKSELGFFGLFRTLPYPINFRKLWAAISLAQGVCDEQAPGPMPATWLSSAAQASATHGSAASGFAASGPAASGAAASGPAASGSAASGPAASGSAVQGLAVQGPAAPAVGHPAPATSPSPHLRHVVLEDTWEVETLSAHAPQQQTPTQLHEATPGMRAAERYAAAHEVRDAAAAPARIPESDAFKRARARRDAANRDAANRTGDKRNAANRNAAKREPVISNQSLAEIAKRFTTQRPFAQLRRLPTGIQRAVLFVGSGVFAVVILAVLTFFFANSNKTKKPANIPRIASLNQPLPHKAFPWQPDTQQPTQEAAQTESDAAPAPTQDLEAQDPAVWDTPADRDPAPPDPAPMSPPPPPQAQALESPAQPADK